MKAVYVLPCLPLLQVIEVRAKKRTGEQSLVSALRKSLEDHYPDKSLALGGSFVIEKGKAKIHIMVPDYIKKKCEYVFK